MLVRYKKNNKLYAMKILHKDHIEKMNAKIYTQNERNIMAILDHPFIVKLHYAF